MIRNRRAYQLIQCRTHSRLLAGAAAVCAAACGHADLALYHLLHRGGAPLPDSTQADRAALTALCPKPAAEGECPPLPPQEGMPPPMGRTGPGLKGKAPVFRGLGTLIWRSVA